MVDARIILNDPETYRINEIYADYRGHSKDGWFILNHDGKIAIWSSKLPQRKTEQDEILTGKVTDSWVTDLTKAQEEYRKTEQEGGPTYGARKEGEGPVKRI